MSVFTKLFVAIGVATFVAGVPPAYAQHRGGGHASGGGHGSVGHASVRAAAPRSFGAARPSGGRTYSVARSVGVAPRAYGYGGPRVYAAQRSGAVVGHAVPRAGGPRIVGSRGVVVARGGYYRPYYPIRFAYPYYTFRPRLSIGFGIWAGFPFAWTYGYYNPWAYAYPYPYYPYAYPYPYYPYSYPAAQYPPYAGSAPYPSYPSSYPASQYPYPTQGSVGVQGSQPVPTDTGGMSFDITPSNADVLVDGTLVGQVGDFTPTSEPLGMAAGRHHIEIRAPGYRPLAFDVDIIAGQVIPYRGTLQQ
jgi:hypothetical protein